MSPSDDEGQADRSEPFGDRVAWAPPSAGGFAYVPGRVLVRGEAAARHVDVITGEQHDPRPIGEREGAPEATWYRIDGIDDPLAVVALMRADGYAAQPDHVLFAHGGAACCCEPHPADAWGCLTGDPYRANPYRANPYRANPYRANPYRANPYRANDAGGSSAIPAPARTLPERTPAANASARLVTVLDTGLADGPQRPALLPPNRIAGAVDLPDESQGPAATSGTLGPVAGHGTFIAGVIEQLAPGCTIGVDKVINALGYAVESELLARLHAIAMPGGQRPDVLSLSFGGTAAEPPLVLAGGIALVQLSGVVVVASAGNDGSCQPQYPAAFDGVVAVAALGPDGPAPWTNYGSWVDACAPGTDLVSAFFADFDGPLPPVGASDPDRFQEWAIWSGTSFATPVVVAALVRELEWGAVDGRAAVERLIHSPAAVRIPNLGTVVTA